MELVKTEDITTIKPYLNKMSTRGIRSHKGQNGKLLIIGGSSLFHAASLWSAAIASKIVDMVHYSSTIENEKIFINLKGKFLDGIIVKKNSLLEYVKEDDCVLIGPGFVRGELSNLEQNAKYEYHQLINIRNEASVTYHLTKHLLSNYTTKRWVIDAGALQMMDKNLLLLLKTKPIITPHALEFEKLFGIKIIDKKPSDVENIAKEIAQKYRCVLLLKIVDDIITDGDKLIRVTGGNAGLTKGGTGDTLAGLCAALNCKNDSFISCVIASYLVKTAAEVLFVKTNYWYSTSDLINQIGPVFNKLMVIMSD